MRPVISSSFWILVLACSFETALGQDIPSDPFLGPEVSQQTANRAITSHAITATSGGNDEWLISTTASYSAEVPVTEINDWVQSYSLKLTDFDDQSLGINQGSWLIARGVKATWSSTISESRTGVTGYVFNSIAKLKLQENAGPGLLNWSLADIPFGYSGKNATAEE